MNKLVIICTDDEPSILSSLNLEINKNFADTCTIELVENAEETLEICEELSEDGDEIALVISDYIMPEMKGDELLKRIHLLLPKTIKVMLTGQADIEAVGNAVKHANLYRYISKPWQPDDLKLTIKEALNSYLQDKKITKYTHKLEKTNQMLVKHNEFLGMAVHDLKNPLASIQGYAEMIVEDYDDMPKLEVIEVNNLIINNSKKMFKLVKNLLDINQIESDKFNFKLSKTDILPIVKIMMENYNARAKLKNISLQLHQQNNQYNAFIDNNIVYQILDNLISNAIKYSPYDKNINIYMQQSEKMVNCKIQDEGEGLSTEDQQKLFGKFARLTPQPTAKEHSTGLGLFIVKKLIEAMNGNVWCESELGKGSSFYVEFPVFLEEVG